MTTRPSYQLSRALSLLTLFRFTRYAGLLALIAHVASSFVQLSPHFTSLATVRTGRRSVPLVRRPSGIIHLWSSTTNNPPTTTTNREGSMSSHQQGAKTTPTTTWYPTRIQDTIDYDQVVERLFVRHVVTATRAMAELALDQVAQGLVTSPDPLATVAAGLSLCRETAAQGGRLGWIDRPTEAPAAWESLLSRDVVQQLYAHRPKAGDMYIVPSAVTGQWHLLQVLELWIHPLAQVNRTARGEKVAQQVPDRLGSFGGRNVVWPPRKLKGPGVWPTVPSTLRTYHIQTAGCQMNVADSERLAGVLQDHLQLTVAERPEQADVVVLNTCSIRDHAEQKVYDALGPFAALKRQGRNLALVVTGCVAQQEGEALLRRIPEVDAVIGPQYIPFLPTILRDHVGTQGQQMVATAPTLLREDTTLDWAQPPVRGHDVRAWVNVIHGCNEHCTYCVVPGTRGMEQSRTMEAILRECLDLTAQGYKEITLLGQNIDAYGRDMVPKRTFAELLEFLNAHLPSPLRLRYVTSHPRYFSDRVIEAVADLDKVCECFHMPFQAGDDHVLKRMRRGYTFDSYLKIIDKIRTKAPDAAICADVIVGFPGETEEAFQKTLQLMEAVKFDNINSFAYSPRPNTEAALFEDQIPEDIKAERLQRVQELAARHGLERSERYLGRTVEVLVEDSNPRNAQQVMGRTRQGRHVYLDGSLAELKGHFVMVKITQARTWSLVGELVHAPLP